MLAYSTHTHILSFWFWNNYTHKKLQNSTEKFLCILYSISPNVTSYVTLGQYYSLKIAIDTICTYSSMLFYPVCICVVMTMIKIQCCSVQFSHSVVSDSLRPHEWQHARPPCPSPTAGVHSDSCPLSPWCHPAISSSVVPFSSCPQSLPASGSFPMSQLFAWGGQSTAVSALASFLPKKSQGWSPSEWTGWISLQSTGTLKLLHHHKDFPLLTTL